MMVKMLVAASTLALVAACTTAQTDTADPSASAPSTLSDPSGAGTAGTGSMSPSTEQPYGAGADGSTGSMSGTGVAGTGSTTGSTTGSMSAGATSDIVTVAQGAGQFTTLVSAIQTAGLVDTLKGPGPYTVFAPTDAAFKALPSGMLNQLMEPANKGRLVSVLTYHVVPGKIASTDISGTQTLKTIQGGSLTVTRSASSSGASAMGAGSSTTRGTTGAASGSTTGSTGASVAGVVRVNDANVVAADVPAANGVVHAIDKVLIPTAKAS